MIVANAKRLVTSTALVACSVVLFACETVSEGTSFNSFPVGTGSFSHEMLAPSGLSELQATDLARLCAAGKARAKGFSRIDFVGRPSATLENGWDSPRYRIVINARYVSAPSTDGSSAEQLMADLGREFGGGCPG